MTRRTPECPSELRLDQLEVGELSDQHAAQVRAHLAGCAFCEGQLAARTASNALFAARATDEVVAELHRQTAGRIPEPVDAAVREALGAPPEKRRWPRWLTDFRPLLAVSVMAAAAIVVVNRPTPPDAAPTGGPVVVPPPPETVTVKGGLGLTLHRERDGKIDTLITGDSATQGDRLRFEIDTPEPGFALVLGVEASGATYVAYPTDGSTDAVALAAGDDVVLPGAIELDASVGREHVALVWCPTPFSAAGLTWSATDERVAPPASGCRTTALRLEKLRAEKQDR